MIRISGRRAALSGLLAATLAGLGQTPAQAQAPQYPTRPITMVVPFAAGGPTDVLARTMAMAMTKHLGQTVVVENTVGAGGTIAANRVAKATPDGYTVFIHHNGMATSVGLYRKLSFNPLEDFEYVGQIADVSIMAGQKQRTREDLAPFIDVTARLEGRDLGSAMADVRRTVAGLHLPNSIRVDYGGLYVQQRQSFADMTMVFVAALLLAALLLTLLFERIAWTLAALVTVLLSAAAVFCGLWISGIELDVSALMGLTMVVGMVTELIVFYLSELDAAAPMDAAALTEAGDKRLRPILMSALIAILTLSPLALGISRGAGLQQPLATAIIFGLTAAVPLVLLVFPALILAISRVPAKSDGAGPLVYSG